MVELILSFILIILAAIYGRQLRAFKLKELVVLSLFVAIAVALRVALQFIPSAKPTSFVIIMAGIIFGPGAGLAVGIAITILSNLVLGMGPWIFWQMFCWGIMGVTAYYMRNTPKIVLAIYGFAWGFIFGWVMNFWWLFALDLPKNFTTIMAGNASSFPLDLVHALTNFILILVFPRKSIEKFIKK